MAQRSDMSTPTVPSVNKVSAVAGASTETAVKRTKTGCRRCRIRRRKCDEIKPRCTYCANRRLECQYPSGLRFLDKNILTVEDTCPARATSKSTPTLSSLVTTPTLSRYQRLRFVATGSSVVTRDSKTNTPSNHSTTPRTPSQELQDSPSAHGHDDDALSDPLPSRRQQHYRANLQRDSTNYQINQQDSPRANSDAGDQHGQDGWQDHFERPRSSASQQAQHGAAAANQDEADIAMSASYLTMDLMPWHPTPTPPSCSPLEHSADDMVLSSEVSEADPARATARSSAEATSTGRGKTTPTPSTAVIITPGEVNSSGFKTAWHALLSLSTNLLSSSADRPQAIEPRGFVDEGAMTDGGNAEQPASASILPDVTSEVTIMSPRQGYDNHNHYNDRHINQSFDVPHVAQLHPIQRGTPRALDTLTAMEVSSDDAVNQIRHYRYNLATWLDVCDTRQFFGTIVSVMALRSKHIRNALLVLSAASLAAPKGDILAERPNEPSESVIIADAHDPISTSLDHHVYTLLLAVANFLRETPAAWTEMWQRVHLSLLADPLSAPEHGLHLSCLRLRLDITVALMQGTGMLLHHAENVPSPATALGGDSSTSTVKDITGGNMVYTVHKMLLLCARILDFRAGVRRQVGVSRMQQWHQLAESANHWYAKRPMAFQPLVDLDLPSSVFGTAEAASAEEAGEDAITRPKGAPTHDELHPLFPSILFTNGTAVLSNQLYHTAMMLLLQSKPRTTIHEQSGVGGGGLNGGSRPSPAWSPLWHAQRVCGIALSNIRRECWDLSLVASLWVAAQTMTYEPQQRALLRGFDALATRMGWQVDHFQVTLRQVWGMES